MAAVEGLENMGCVYVNHYVIQSASAEPEPEKVTQRPANTAEIKTLAAKSYNQSNFSIDTINSECYTQGIDAPII